MKIEELKSFEFEHLPTLCEFVLKQKEGEDVNCCEYAGKVVRYATLLTRPIEEIEEHVEFIHIREGVLDASKSLQELGIETLEEALPYFEVVFK